LSVGFKSADAFRRAFERRLGVSPSDYRRRFGSAAKPPSSVRRRLEPTRISAAA
jgi:AraC-like DNA-binding protein